MIVEPEVVGEFASGSHEAFHKIFKLFYPKVYAFIRGFIKDLDDSEDLTQIVFIKLWNKRAIFHKVHHFDSYLFMLTKYTVFNYITTKKVSRFTSIIRKSKFPQNPKRSVRFSGKRTKRSVQKRKARNTQKAETKVL